MAGRSPVVIGFTGRAGSGKSTACAYLVKTVEAVEIAFADRLKDLCHGLFQQCGVTRDAWYGSQADKARPWGGLGGLSGRQVLQLVGTDCFRSINPDVWARIAESQARAELEAGTRVIVFPDVRFQSEVAAVRRLGGAIVKLTRGTPPWYRRPFEHASERGVDYIVPDFVIDNRHGSASLLKVRVAKLFHSLS